MLTAYEKRYLVTSTYYQKKIENLKTLNTRELGKLRVPHEIPHGVPHGVPQWGTPAFHGTRSMVNLIFNKGVVSTVI